MTDVTLLEGLETTRSIRRYVLEPLPEADLNRIVFAATRAPSGTNRQPFRFISLSHEGKGAEARKLLGEAFRSSWAQKCRDEGWEISLDERADSRRGRMLQAMEQYVTNFERTPAILLACFKRYRPLNHAEGASIFPACQNVLLAARALGYGGCFSGWHFQVEDELRELLGIPEDVELSLTITLGRPQGSHGPVRRRPLAELVYEDAWESSPSWAVDPPGTRFTRGGPPEKQA